VSSFISTHRFDPQHPENFFVKRMSLAPIIKEMVGTRAAYCRLATRREADRPELLFFLPSVSDESIEALARDFPSLHNSYSPDCMHLAPQFTWGQEGLFVVIMAGDFFYDLTESKRGGFGIAFFNERVGYYSHGRLNKFDKECLWENMNVLSSYSMNYRPYREWSEEYLEEHRGKNDAPPEPGTFPLNVIPAEG